MALSLDRMSIAALGPPFFTGTKREYFASFASHLATPSRIASIRMATSPKPTGQRDGMEASKDRAAEEGELTQE